jgi:predicted HAD superfamily Cof-like phosphohydrolase
MNSAQAAVLEFHKAFDLYYTTSPSIPDSKQKHLRVSLIQEELDELQDALINEDIISVADAIADLLYVVYGAALACGLDMEPIFNEVHRSNMAKVGGVIREDGKLMKPDTWTPPNLKIVMYDEDGTPIGWVAPITTQTGYKP